MVEKRVIEKTFDSVLSLKCNIVKSVPYYATAMDMCDKYGLELVRCNRTELRFVDKGHTNPLNDTITETEIRLDKLIGGMYISFTNDFEDLNFNEWEDKNNKETWTMDRYTLDEFLGLYDGMPLSLKNRVGMIVYDQEDFIDNGSIIYDRKYHRQNVIRLTSEAFYSSSGVMGSGGRPYFTLERILAHEMGHCFEFGKLTPNEIQIVKNLSKGTEKSVEDYRRYIEPKVHMYSHRGGVFWDAVMDEADGGSVEFTMNSNYAKKYYLSEKDNPNTCLGEHFAETVSIVSFKNKSDKSNAKILFDSMTDEVRDYDTIMNNQRVSVGVVEDLLDI